MKSCSTLAHYYDRNKDFNLLNSGAARVAVAQNRDIFGDFTFHSDGNASQMLSEITVYVSSHNLPLLYILIDFLAKSLK